MEKHGGKREGAGRKSKAEELGLPALIDSVCGIEKQREIIRQLAKDSLSKDFYQRSESRKLLLAYKFGKPAQTLDIGNKPGEAFEIATRAILPRVDDTNSEG